MCGRVTILLRFAISSCSYFPRSFSFNSFLFLSLPYMGAGRSTGALRGVVLDASAPGHECGHVRFGWRRESAISARIRRGDSWSTCCLRERTRRGGGGRNVAAISRDSSGAGSGDAADVQVESGGRGNRSRVGRSRVETNPSSISALVDDKAIGICTERATVHDLLLLARE